MVLRFFFLFSHTIYPKSPTNSKPRVDHELFLFKGGSLTTKLLVYWNNFKNMEGQNQEKEKPGPMKIPSFRNTEFASSTTLFVRKCWTLHSHWSRGDEMDNQL